MKKHLSLATAVLATPLLVHADLKVMNDGALSNAIGQAGINISGTFQSSVGTATYTDTDTNGGSLQLENISLPALTIDDAKPLTIDIITTDVGGKSIQQLAVGLPVTAGDVTVSTIKVGDTNVASTGSLTTSGLNMAGSTIKVWGHWSRSRAETRRPRRGIGGAFLWKRYDGAMFEVSLGSLIGLSGFAQTVDTKLQPQNTVNLSQPLTPNGPYRESVRLEPMSQLQFRNVIRQAYNYNRGPVALTTLLDYYLGRNLEERQITEGLLRYGEAGKIVQRRGFSLLGMKHYVTALDYRDGGFHAEFSDLDTLEHPVPVPIHYTGFKHSVAVRDVYNNHVFAADPALGNISFTRTRFEEIWGQDILFVVFPSGQEPRNALALNDCNMRLMDGRTVNLLAFHELPQINKITENQVRELGTGGDVVYLRTRQQMPKNKNNLWGQRRENQGIRMRGGANAVYQRFIHCRGSLGRPDPQHAGQEE